YEVQQGALPPPGADKAFVVIGGKRYEITKAGDVWKSASTLPDPGSTKGMIVDYKNAPGGPAGDLAAEGFIIINTKKYEVQQGALPPPGADKAFIIIGSKKYEITKAGDGWKSASVLPDPGSTKGVIIDWKPAGGPGGDLAAKGIIINFKKYEV